MAERRRLEDDGTVTMGNAALLLAASQVDRLDWAAQMVGIDDRMAARIIAAWRMNRDVKAMARRLEPQIRKVA